MQVEQLERLMLALAASIGPEALDIAEQARAEFDATLNGDPTALTPIQILHREAGVLHAV